mmetsp:Transcript_20068/g.47040  ORF Transcript_20068/g.47040 Transcript_20068/m.47040 type:complete len:257 (-) Transcript_20068:1202-1972(-)
MNPPRLYFPAMPWTSFALSTFNFSVLIKRRQSLTPARSRLLGTVGTPAAVVDAGVVAALGPQSIFVFGVFAKKSFRDSIFGSSSSSSMAVSISMPPSASPDAPSVLISVLSSDRKPAKSMPPPADAAASLVAVTIGVVPVPLKFRLKFASWNFISSDLRAFRSFCNFSVAFSKDSVTPRNMPCVSSCFFFRTAASKRESISTVTCVMFCDLLLSSSRTWSSSFLCSVNSVLPSAHFLFKLMSCSFRASDFLLHSSN